MTRGKLLTNSVSCLLAAGFEIYIYIAYRAHDARFHWFTHFFVGASTALLLMTLVVWKRRRPMRFPLLWIILGHLVAMFPDFLFTAGIAHQRWMDIFLGHISSHFIPGRNWTWYAVFLLSLAIYLTALDHCVPDPAATRRREARSRARTRHGGRRDART